MAGFLKVADLIGPSEGQVARDSMKIMHQNGTAIIRRFASNVEIEERVPADVWKAVIVQLVSKHPITSDAKGAQELATLFRDVFASELRPVPDSLIVPSVLPVGPTISDLKPGSFGRLVTMTQLVKMWQQSSSVGFGPRAKPLLSAFAVKSIVENLATIKGWQIITKLKSFSEMPLGRYVIWSTFDGINLGKDPFHPRQSKVADLMEVLGLDSLLLFGLDISELKSKDANRGQCLLLQYQVPDSILPHIPTVVEAYAGNGRMNYYFEVWRGDVDVPARRFPKTLPVPSQGEALGIPEVVHSVVFADKLCAPIEIGGLL